MRQSLDKLLCISQVRRKTLPVICIWCVYYAYVFLYATWFGFFDISLVSLDASRFQTTLHISLLVSVFLSAIITHGKWRKSVTTLAAVCNVVLSGLLLLIPSLATSIPFAMAQGLFFGVFCFYLLYAFCFYLNRTERIYAIVFSNILFCLFALVPSEYTRQSVPFYILVLVAAAVTLALKLVPYRYEIEKRPEVVFTRDMKITLMLGIIGSFCSTGIVVLTANRDIAIGSADLMPYLYFGGILGALVFFAINLHVRYSTLLNINLSFALTILGVALSLAELSSGAISLFAKGAALTYGMICVYYEVGLYAKQYNSSRYLNYIIAGVGVIGGIAAPSLVASFPIVTSDALFEVCAIISAAMMLSVLCLSPYISTRLIESTEHPTETVEGGNEPSDEVNEEDKTMDIFEGYGFSKRETEVALLLLQGMTMRQISAELNISQSTVNTYCNSIYRKCGINSRTELILKFK